MADHLCEDTLHEIANDSHNHFQPLSPSEATLNSFGTYGSDICSADEQHEVSLMQRNSESIAETYYKHRTLSPFRVVRGIICLTILLSTAFMMLVYLGVVTAVLLRMFSVCYSRKLTSFFFGKWLALWPSLFEKLNKTKVIWYGDAVPSRERVLLLCNHRTEVDWMYLWNFAIRKGRLGYIKYILKSSLMKLPIFGWDFHIFEFIPVQRKWESDEQLMHHMLSTFVDPQDPLWLVVFPEGTDYTEQKCIRSQKFAKEKGLPVLKHLLLPMTKGVAVCLEVLRNSLDAGSISSDF